MAAYVVVDTDWKSTDADTRAAFGRAAQPVIRSYGGQFLTPPGERSDTLEGDWTPEILTIIEFPDMARARACWASSDFRAAVAIRQRTPAVFKAVLVHGVPSESAPVPNAP
jgi:uncharacterized protein (DUF1330 family)